MRVKKAHHRSDRRRHFSAAAALLSLIAIVALGGCTENKPTTRPSSWIDQAQADPWHFDPQMQPVDITGGGLTHFDKDAFNRDLDDVFNP